MTVSEVSSVTFNGQLGFRLGLTDDGWLTVLPRCVQGPLMEAVTRCLYLCVLVLPSGTSDGDGGPEALLSRRTQHLVRLQHRRNSLGQDSGSAQRRDHALHHRLQGGSLNCVCACVFP